MKNEGFPRARRVRSAWSTCLCVIGLSLAACGDFTGLGTAKSTDPGDAVLGAADGNVAASGADGTGVTTAAASKSRRGCKRGIATSANGGALLSAKDIAALSPNVAWYYNWGPSPGDANVVAASRRYGMEYVPMAWNGHFDANAIVASLTPNSRYLLAFNEPNFTAQGNLTPEAAAALWPSLQRIADQHNLKIVSPALNYCGGGCNQTSPFTWLDRFFAACPKCRVDYLAIHAYVCYGSALDSAYLTPFARYKRPLWLTEFACGDGSADGKSLAVQKRYMTEAVTALEANPNVFRYSWFLARTHGANDDPIGLLGDDGKLTELGKLYVSLPASCDAAPK